MPAPDAVRAVDGLEANLHLQERGAAVVRGAARTRRAGSRIRRTEGGVRQRHNPGSQAEGAHQGRSAHRRLHDCRQRCYRAVSRGQPDSRAPTDCPLAGALGAHRGAGVGRTRCDCRNSRTPLRWPNFLRRQRADDPENFPVLSLAVLKLLGRGEYVAEIPGDATPGHFGLAVEAYTHSTAPNRRFPDLDHTADD